MEFSAFLVKSNSSPSINLGLIGVILFLVAIFFWAFPSLETVALILSVSGIVLVIIGAIAGKGKALIEVDDKLVKFNDRGIEVKSTFYQYRDVIDLDFYYHSYYSQSPAGYYTENAGLIEYGMSNRLSFRSGAAEVSETFFLGNQDHANSFLLLLRDLKQNSVPYKITYRPYR